MKSLNILTIFVFLLFSALSSTNFLPKYGSIEISSQYVAFDSKDFKNDEEMYFKIETRQRNYKTQSYVEYQYIANKNDVFSSSAKTYNVNFHDSIEHRDSYSYYTYHYSDCDYYYYDNTYYYDYYSYYTYEYCYYVYETKYFKIKKKSSEFEGTNGDYIIFKLPVNNDYIITITNTKDDESKTITIIVIVVVVLVVVGILIAIIVCCCRRIKRNKAIAASQAAQAAAYSQQQNMQAQAYQAQAAYQGQAYPPQSYPVPIAQNNAGYSSAGGFIPA